ncbi:MAG: LamG domain-containing protein [Spirochaetes bacterium]|nr:LamG domain-containing protein [Spirochaetota bacterium]
MTPGGVSGNYLAIAQKDDGYCSLGTAYGFTGDFSFSLWLRTAPRYSPTESIILDRHSTDGSWNGYFLFVNTAWGYGSPNKVTFYYTNGTVISKTSINDGKWHQVGIVYHKNAGVELYVDGNLETKGPPPPIPMDTRANVNFVLGSMTWDKPHGNLGGDLDELLLFDQALGPADMAYLAANPQNPGSQEGGPAIPSGGQMKILMKDGRVISVPTADILRIEFGN